MKIVAWSSAMAWAPRSGEKGGCDSLLRMRTGAKTLEPETESVTSRRRWTRWHRDRIVHHVRQCGRRETPFYKEPQTPSVVSL